MEREIVKGYPELDIGKDIYMRLDNRKIVKGILMSVNQNFVENSITIKIKIKDFGTVEFSKGLNDSFFKLGKINIELMIAGLDYNYDNPPAEGEYRGVRECVLMAPKSQEKTNDN